MIRDPHDAKFIGGTSLPGGAFIGKTDSPRLHVMSWNIRRRAWYPFQRDADQWSVRAPRLRALLQAERPALMGMQEALADQVDFVRESLGSGYRSVGYGRGDRRQGERCPILYDDSRLELLSWEQSALSDQPTEPGSRSWGNLVPRILVTTAFRDRKTSKRLQLINTHFDHLSARSRLRSAHALAGVVAASEYPTIVTGDLNAGPGSAPLKSLLADDALVDAVNAAQVRLGQAWGTVSAYRAPQLDRPRLDWILVSPDLQVRTAGINGSRYGGGWGSDHLPVQAVIEVA